MKSKVTSSYRKENTSKGEYMTRVQIAKELGAGTFQVNSEEHEDASLDLLLKWIPRKGLLVLSLANT